MEDLISVIVITYNEEKTIGRTLDSILSQKCHLPFEIVIGEDCSTDNTRLICEEYAAKYPDTIRLMDKTSNKGIIDNFYDCLLACRGKYIADCDGDDFWVSTDKLERQLCILENHEDVVLVHTDWVYYDELTKKTTGHRPQPHTAPITDGNKMSEDIFTFTNGFVIHLCTAMFRAETFLEAYREDTFLFRNKNFACEDTQACFALSRKGKIAYIPEVMMYYSSGKPSACRQPDNKKQFRFIKRNTDMEVYICRKYGIRNKKTDNHLQARMFALFMFALRDESIEMRDEARIMRKEWGVKPSFRIFLVDTVTSYRMLWKTALLLRKAWTRRNNKSVVNAT